ncbi:MAG TPA: hypothetical protein VFQ07_00175 [Candidatus Polarisedimenticolia bacterium]|nr:hypothetical protein [Candidatus Polarisedimenticolia bacterium]
MSRPKNGQGPVRRLVAVTAALLVGGTGVLAQDLKRPEEQLAALYALRIQLEVEQKILDDDLLAYQRTADQREAARARVRQLYDELDDIVAGKTQATSEELDQREAALGRAEQELDALTRAARDLRVRIRDSQERIQLLTDKSGKLRRTLPSDNETLTGTWDVTYLPTNDKGSFTLRQSGTILAGEYSLEGGWRGSLQGTFVNGKILLHRIDSKLGHSQDLEGAIAPDGKTLRGRWQNFILSGGQATSGDWVAQKRDRGDS